MNWNPTHWTPISLFCILSICFSACVKQKASLEDQNSSPQIDSNLDTTLDSDTDSTSDSDMDSMDQTMLDLDSPLDLTPPTETTPFQIEATWTWNEPHGIGIRYQAEVREHYWTTLQIRLIDSVGETEERRSLIQTHQDIRATLHQIQGAVVLQDTEPRFQDPPNEVWIKFSHEHQEDSRWVLAQPQAPQPLERDALCRLNDPFHICPTDTTCSFSLDRPSSAEPRCHPNQAPQNISGTAYFNQDQNSFGLQLSGHVPPPLHIEYALLSFYNTNGDPLAEKIVQRYLHAAPPPDEQGHFNVELSLPWLRTPQNDLSLALPATIKIELVNTLDQKSEPLLLSVQSPLRAEEGDRCDSLEALTLCPDSLSCLEYCTHPDQLETQCPENMDPIVIEGLSGEIRGHFDETRYSLPRWCFAWGPTEVYQYTAPQRGFYVFKATSTSGKMMELSLRSHCGYSQHQASCSRAALSCNGESAHFTLMEEGETLYLFVGSYLGRSRDGYRLSYREADEDDLADSCF